MRHSPPMFFYSHDCLREDKGIPKAGSFSILSSRRQLFSGQYLLDLYLKGFWDMTTIRSFLGHLCCSCIYCSSSIICSREVKRRLHKVATVFRAKESCLLLFFAACSSRNSRCLPHRPSN